MIFIEIAGRWTPAPARRAARAYEAAPGLRVGYHCTYVTDWIADKTRWGLAVDPAETMALAAVLGGCPDAPVHTARAR